MAIVYPLTMPTTRGPNNIQIDFVDVVGISESPFTLSQQVQELGGQRWQASVSLAPMKRVDAEPWLAFLGSLKGRLGTFFLGDPNGVTPRGVATGTPLVNGGNQQGNQLIIDGCTPSITGWMKMGDYIQLNTGSNYRLHKLLQDVNTDSGGNATLTIWPDLRESPANNQAIITANTVGLFRLTTNLRSWSTGVAGIYSITFAAYEAL